MLHFAISLNPKHLECAEKFWNNFLILSSFLVLWENVFHIVAYLFNFKRSVEAEYPENAAKAETHKNTINLRNNLFVRTFLCQLLTSLNLVTGLN